MIRLMTYAVAGTLVLLSVRPMPAVAATGVRVAYSDLDLSTEAGRATLDRRLVSAANRVCPAQPSELAMRMACRRDVLDYAHRQLPARATATLIATLR